MNEQMSENLGTHVEAAAIAGWNACRKSVYAVCEDVQEQAPLPTDASMARTGAERAHEKGFYAGKRSAAKSIARGFNAMEAQDDSHFRDALAALTAGSPSGAVGAGMVDRVATAIREAGTPGYTCTFEDAARSAIAAIIIGDAADIIVDAVMGAQRFAPKLIPMGAHTPLFDSMQPENDGPWVSRVDVAKRLRAALRGSAS